jgi:Ca-activated chloride channel family protein
MRRTASALLLGMLAMGFAPTGAERQAQAQEQPQATFRSGVEAVSVTASVRDAQGRVVRNLSKADFEIIDDGRRREIRDFFAGDAPVSLALLLDISGSMAVGGNMERAREAISVATMALRNGPDEAALYTFDSELQEVVGFTKDISKVRGVSLKGKPWGKTSLFDAIATAARNVAARENRHRALMVITDGVDTGSRMTAPQVSAIAASIDVPVYLITVVNPVDHIGGEFGVQQTETRVAETATLADLARWTGGDMRVASEPLHTQEAIEHVFLDLRHQYLITFEPGARPGWHPLEIRTRKKELVVRARSGYMAGPAQSESHRR